MTQEFWRPERGRRWHIYNGLMRSDFTYPRMVMRCGVTVDEVVGFQYFGTPPTREVCERCQGGPVPWRIEEDG